MKNLIVVPVVIGLALVSMSMTANNTENQTLKPMASEAFQGVDPEVKPEFIGGQDALFAYMGENMKYPKSLVASDAKGKVMVEFTVAKDGSIKNAKVLKGCEHDEMNDEALRVIKNMPDWKPGEKDGKVVSTKMVLPIIFTL